MNEFAGTSQVNVFPAANVSVTGATVFGCREGLRLSWTVTRLFFKAGKLIRPPLFPRRPLRSFAPHDIHMLVMHRSSRLPVLNSSSPLNSPIAISGFKMRAPLNV